MEVNKANNGIHKSAKATIVVQQVKKIVQPIVVFAVIIAMLVYSILIEHKHINRVNLTAISKDSTHTIDGSIYGVSHKNLIVPLGENYYLKAYIFIGDTSAIDYISYSSNGIVNKITSIRAATTLISNPSEKYINYEDGFKGKQCYTITLPTKQYTAAFPYFGNIVNWNGDANFLYKLLVHPFFLFSLIIFFFRRKLLLFWKCSNTNNTLLTINPLWLQYLLIVVPFLLLSWVIIANDKYYFLQDDNYAQFTPLLLNGMEEWYNTGIFPTYNAYQAGGLPVYETGTNSFLYPLTHFAYCIARYVCNDVLQFNNVYALIHFFIGYVFTYKLLRLLSINFWLALSAAFGFVFCGFNLETVRSWYYVAPSVAFLPLLTFLIYKFRYTNLNWKHFVVVIILVTAYMYSGNFQFFTYTLLFCIALFISTFKANFLGKINVLIIVIVPSCILFVPQAISTYMLLKNVYREGGQGVGILNGFMGIVFPFFSGDSHKPNGWGSAKYSAYSGYFYAGAFLFLIVAFVSVSLQLYKGKKIVVSQPRFINLVALLFAISFLLAIGKSGVLWYLQSKLPFFNKFNHPFKFFLYVQFFGVVYGAYLWQLFLQRKNEYYSFCIALVSIVVSFFNASQTKDAFFIYAPNHNSYKALPYEQLFNKGNNFRTMSYAVSRSEHSSYASSLYHNFASMYKVNSALAYEPLAVNNFGDNVSNAKHSIRYYIISTYTTHSTYFGGNLNAFTQPQHKDSLIKVWQDEHHTIWEDKHYEPLVQLLDSNGKCISNIKNVTNTNSGIVVNITQPVYTSTILLSYNALPHLSVYCNGKQVPHTTDAYHRIVVKVNASISTIALQYKPFPFYLF